MFKTIKNQKGFSLVDLIMTAAILPILFAVLVATAQASGSAMRAQVTVAALNHSGQQMLRSIARELSQSDPIDGDGQFFITDGTPFDSIRFRVPVDFDGDGDVTGATEDAFEWGATAPSNTTPGTWAAWQNHWIRYQVTGTTLYREVLDTNLALVSGYQFPVAKNLTLFSVTKNSNLVTVSATFQEQDSVGQFGQARNYSQTYTLTTESIMRNVMDGG
ncbi:MAG TPA: type II secretion system protein [Candidatus Omnitrophota bacterium]|nr:type II secretion system protein [Candidatus Omnitrophota bacterium]